MSADIIPFQEKHLGELKDIFFESSTKKNFVDENEREAFFYKYAGFYLENYPSFCLVAVSDRVLGYVLGAPETTRELYKLQPHLVHFESEFGRYPAHLHMNCHSAARGQGVGGMLLDAFVELLAAPGLHIMTGKDVQNVSFYRKHGFVFERLSHNILFMGRTL